MMVRQLIVQAALLSVLAANVSAHPFVSCVGKQFTKLQEAAPYVHEASNAAAICLARKNLSVCRVLLNGDQPDNRTMKVTVIINGAIAQTWFESADSAYLRRFHVLASRPALKQPWIVIATQQSESQGMRAQEWLVNTVNGSGRHVFTTSEFGPEGSLVYDRTKRSLACKLLLTQWSSRHTKAGERMFLLGRAYDLDANDPPDQESALVFSKRLDRTLSELRANEPANRPLVYFKRTAH